jgi:PAS domain S-box-containing protein
MSHPNGLRSHVRRLGLAYLVLLVCLALTLATSFLVRRSIRARQWERFRTTADFVFEASGHDLSYFLLLLQGVRGLFVESVPEPKEVRAYFKSIQIKEVEKKEALQGVGLIWRVTPENEAEFLEYFQKHNLTNIISGWQHSTEERFPIVDFESNNPKAQRVLGWDVGTDPVRREVLKRAFEAGGPAMTPKVELFMPDLSKGVTGFVVYLPIFDGGIVPETTEARKEKFLGYVFGSFDADKFFRGIMAKREPIINLKVLEGANSSENLLYQHDRIIGPEAPVHFVSSISGDIFGRRWFFYFSEAAGLWSAEERTLEKFVFWGGVLVSLCFFGIVSVQVQGRKTAEELNAKLQESAAQLRASKEELEGNLISTKQAQKELAHSLSLQLATLESTADGILVVDRNGKIVSYNQRFVSMWAMPEELLKSGNTEKARAYAFDQIADGEAFLKKRQEIYAHPEGESHDELIFKDGRVFESYSRPQKVGNEIVGRLWSFRDVTDSRQAEQSLIRREKQYRDLVETSHDLIWSVDSEGRWTFLNQAARRIYGYEPAEMLGRPFTDFESAEQREKDWETFTAVKAGKPASHYVTQHLRKDGSPVWLSFNAIVLRDEEGNVAGTTGTASDITEARKFEAEMLKTSKLESIGLLAGGIAHDFNNILTIIIGNISLLRTTPALSSAENNSSLEEVEKAAFRARELTQQLLTFAKGGAPIRHAESIAAILRDSTEFALRGSNVRAEYAFAEQLSAVDVDAGQMGQVIQNLIINAKQSMPEGGVIKLSAENRSVGREDGLPLRPGKYVVFSVRDHGNGIPKEHLAKIFDPYFTTKRSGTGLGLATAYSIVKRHDGLITVKSEPGEGTAFQVYLRASTAVPVQRASRNGALTKGSGRILGMDDEAPIRTLLAAILRQLGYDIRTVADGAEAIREYQSAIKEGKPYAAVIMDLTVPGGMGGREAIRELLEIDPKVKAIVSSGYSSDPVMSEYKAYGFAGVVEKPYRMQELGRVVQEVLRNSSEATQN